MNYEAQTQYEKRVPKWLRDDVETKVSTWVKEGRDDRRIESLIRSLVLAACGAGYLNG